MVVNWVDDPSSFDFLVNDPAWVGDPEDVEDPFLMAGSSRANTATFPEVFPPLWEDPIALGGIGNFLPTIFANVALFSTIVARYFLFYFLFLLDLCCLKTWGV